MSDTDKKEEVKLPTSEEILEPKQEDQVEQKETQFAEPDPEELLARQSGWVPESEWKGDPKSWRPAKDFNERGELLSRIKAQSKELINLKSAMEFLTSQQQKQFKLGYEKAIVDLKAARQEALREGDLVKAQDITDQIDEMKDEQRKVVDTKSTQQRGPSEVFKEWFAHNTWYTKDKVMTRFAEAEGASFKEDNPDATEADMLSHVARVIRKQFSDKFAPKSAPSPDGEGRGGTTKKSTSTSDPYKSVKESMTDEQRQIMRTILKTTKMKEEDYIKQFVG
jgi:hypothetical protein